MHSNCTQYEKENSFHPCYTHRSGNFCSQFVAKHFSFTSTYKPTETNLCENDKSIASICQELNQVRMAYLQVAKQACPSIVIDNDGYIWEADQYYKICSGEASGWVDYCSGKIYAKDKENSLFSAPIGYLEEKNGVTEIYDEHGSLSACPILYVKNGQLYTPERFFSIFNNPNGYIKTDTVASSPVTKVQSESKQPVDSAPDAIESVFMILSLVALVIFIRYFAWILLAVLVLEDLYLIIQAIRKKYRITAKSIARGICAAFGMMFLGGLGVYLAYLFFVYHMNLNALVHDSDIKLELTCIAISIYYFMEQIEKGQ